MQEKDPNFLYLIAKNHTFIDGNKRIAATLFIYFLEFYNILYNENGQVIDNNTLVAITLLIAQSNPKEKEILIDLVMNFLKNDDWLKKIRNKKCLYYAQRVALIRTLALNPDILLLDEPFSALDYQTRLSLSDDLKKIINDEGKTAIMVTHDIAEAISMSDKVIVITNRPGKIKEIIDINLESVKTPTENRKDKYFTKYYEKIWKELDNHVQWWA